MKILARKDGNHVSKHYGGQKPGFGDRRLALTVLDKLSDSIVLTDANGRIIDVNQAATELFGLPRAHLLNSNINWLIPFNGQRQNDESLALLQNSPNSRYEKLWMPHMKTATDVEVLIEPISLAKEDYLLISLRDISGYVRTYSALSRLALTDELTGLCNRRHFLQVLDKELHRLKRYPDKLSLVMFDIDHFKGINDTYGHNIGDAVLKHLAQMAQRVFRDIDVISRLGGDEFIVMLPKTDADQAFHAANRLREMIKQLPLQSSQGEIIYTISAGVVESTQNRLQADDLIREADHALYASKAKGRDQVKTA